jgi:hydroxymethylpyrimidine/phosphomethylpyrimidine kinase
VVLQADFVTAQLEALAADFAIGAVKTGMLADAAIVEAVAAAVDELEFPNLVVDPVLASSSGTRLLDEDGVQLLISLLFPRARVVTPNIPEAEALSGIVILSPADLRAAAGRLHDAGPAVVIITGGHAIASDDTDGEVVDLLFDGGEFTELRTRRVPGGDVHGTGCTFAAALAARLARGEEVRTAAAAAQTYAAATIARRLHVGRAAVPGHFESRRQPDDILE